LGTTVVNKHTGLLYVRHKGIRGAPNMRRRINAS